MASEHWAVVVRPICEETDARRGQSFLYSSEELESVSLYQRAAGCLTMKEALRNLSLPESRQERQSLGFDRPRNPGHRAENMKRLDGLPSPATMSNHNGRIPSKTRAAYWERLCDRFRDEELSCPGMEDEVRIINLDGCLLPIAYTCPVWEVAKTAVVPERKPRTNSTSPAGRAGYCRKTAMARVDMGST